MGLPIYWLGIHIYHDSTKSLLERARNISEARMDGILESHVIDPTALRADNFQAFCDSHQNKILGLIKRATGKGIVRTEVPSQRLEAEEEVQFSNQEIQELS
jgi:hypothetical protein